MRIRRIGVLLKKEFVFGSKSYFFIFAVAAPLAATLMFNLILYYCLKKSRRVTEHTEQNILYYLMLYEQSLWRVPIIIPKCRNLPSVDVN